MTKRIASVAYVICLISVSIAVMAQKSTDDPVKKLGAFVGKWQSEGTLTSGGGKIQSELECRWSPQNRYLVCEQQVHMGGAVNDQLTVYGYDSAAGKYYYSNFQGKSAGASTGMLEIDGNLWTYNSSFEKDGKRNQIRTTNEFTDPKTEVFKVNFSEDGGATWKLALQGTAHKIGD